MSKKEKNLFMRILSNRYIQTLVAMAVITCTLVALTMFGLNIYTKHGESVTVPSLRGLQEEEVSAILYKSGLQYEIIDSLFLTGGTPGAVIEQVPEEGANVKKGRTIYITTKAKGVEMVTIPELRDLSRRQAVATLESLGFSNIIIDEVPSVYTGLVIDITYKGEPIGANQKLPKGDPITLTVGAGGEVLIDSIIDYIPDYDDEPIVTTQNSEKPVIDNSFFE